MNVTQILSPNSLKPRSEHLLCSVRTRLRLANAFNERGLQDLTMYPMRSLQGNAHAIQNQRIFPPSISQNGIFFCLPGYDQSFEKKHQFHKSYTHTLAHNAQERHEWRLGKVDLKHACMAVLGSISCNDPIFPSVSTTQLFHNLPRYHPLV